MRKFIGYETLINNFKNRCMNNTLSHAHLIAGEDGIGKSKLANILAKLILNSEIDREYIDIINYRSNKASFGVDDVRNIIEEVSKKPFEGDKKVIIIHEGNKLTTQAQNALLKTIEEPPNGVYIMILCESLELILDTIKSRCEIYKLTPLTKEELYEYIRIKNFNYNENEMKSAIAFSEGIPGRIDRYFNDDNLKELRSKLIYLIKDLNKNNVEVILQYEEKLSGLKDNKEEVLNILGGIDSPSSGQVIIDNHDITKFNDNELTDFRAENIGFIFQFYNLIPNLTALENVSLIKDIVKNPLNPKKVLEDVGLKNHINKFPSQLSGGEQQRVSIARALCKNPKVILGDEPTGALDSETGVIVLELLQKMSIEKNTTVVIVTHNAEVAKCADKVIRMKNGKVVSVTINENPLTVSEVDW